VAFPINDSNEAKLEHDANITSSSASGGRKFSLNDQAAVASTRTGLQKYLRAPQHEVGEWTPKGT
jgi:hypothetical protein